MARHFGRAKSHKWEQPSSAVSPWRGRLLYRGRTERKILFLSPVRHQVLFPAGVMSGWMSAGSYLVCDAARRRLPISAGVKKPRTKSSQLNVTTWFNVVHIDRTVDGSRSPSEPGRHQ